MAIKPFREAAVYPPDAFPPTLIILKNMLMLRPLLLIFLILLSGRALQAQRQLEDLGRGVVAVHQGAGKVYVGWRMLGTDPADIAFNLYRTTGKGKPLRLNRQPLTASTNFTDQVPDLGQGNAYFVRPVVKGKEQEASAAFTLPAQAPVQPYLSIPLHPIAGYTPNDASAADLDGDGEYEIVLHQTGRGRDTPSNGLTDEPLFQAYKLDGTLLWTINLGRNIREGAHYTQFIVIDMDGDGKAEFACKTADGTKDGKGLFTTGLRHGDALHVTDLDPARPGLEAFGVHENEHVTSGPGAAVYDARTGEILWKGLEGKDVGRGVAADIDPANPGAEMWFSGSGGLLNLKGERIGDNPASTNFLVWWDGDLSRELLDGNHIDKYGAGRLFTAEGCTSNNGTKSTPALSADILGDWREEVILRTTDNKELRIFTTTIPTEVRMPTLMHDPQYRLAVAWQNVAYNQPPHPSFHIGAGMKPVRQVPITVGNRKQAKAAATPTNTKTAKNR
jgi:hypothetical protein